MSSTSNQPEGGSLTIRPTKPLEHDPTLVRELIVGPDNPVAPYPIYLDGWVERGFGRGSKDLGCPTANLPDSSLVPYNTTLGTGVHYGYARVLLSSDSKDAPLVLNGKEASQKYDSGSNEDDQVWPMVMSIGWNPFYNNTTRTAEVHILHPFKSDFYGKELRVVILGFIRPELNYGSLDALIKDINTDKEVSLQSVSRPHLSTFAQDPFFTRGSTLLKPDFDPNVAKAKGETTATEEKI